MNRVESSSDPDALTPSAVLSLYRQGLANPKRLPFALGGVMRLGSGQVYRDGYTYDRLEDSHGAAFVTVRLPVALRALVGERDPVLLRGYLEPRLKPELGVIDVQFVAMELLSHGKPQVDPRQERRLEVLTKRLERPTRAVDSLLRERLFRGQRVRVALILGVTAVVGEDVRGALGAGLASFELRELRVNVTSPGALAAAIRDADASGVDLIAVVRGGGSGLEAFDDPDLAESALELDTPLVVALGHAVDVPLLARVADAAFDTPSLLGAHWRTLSEDVARAEGTSNDAVRRRAEAPLLARIDVLERRNGQWPLIAVALVLIGLLIGAGLWALLRRPLGF